MCCVCVCVGVCMCVGGANRVCVVCTWGVHVCVCVCVYVWGVVRGVVHAVCLGGVCTLCVFGGVCARRVVVVYVWGGSPCVGVAFLKLGMN